MYRGNRLTCNMCKFKPKDILNPEPCKSLDHNIIKLYPKTFSGYSGSINSLEICGHYKPAKWIKNSSFNNIEEYIDFMDNEWHITSNYYKEKGLSSIRHFRYISLIIQDIWVEVPLYDWMMNTWRIDNRIKYIRMYEIKRNAKGKITKKIRIDSLKLGEFDYYLLTDETLLLY